MSRSGKRWTGVALAPLLLLPACQTPAPEAPANTRTPTAGAPPSAPTPEGPAQAANQPSPEATSRVGNYDPRGVDSQPDFDGEARVLANRVRPRLPKPLPTDAAKACRAMFKAVDQFYGQTALAGTSRHRITNRIQGSRAQDQQACEAETSPAAAACVTVLLEDREAEFPWLLDQCTRAFPRA